MKLFRGLICLEIWYILEIYIVYRFIQGDKHKITTAKVNRVSFILKS